MNGRISSDRTPISNCIPPVAAVPQLHTQQRRPGNAGVTAGVTAGVARRTCCGTYCGGRRRSGETTSDTTGTRTVCLGKGIGLW